MSTATLSLKTIHPRDLKLVVKEVPTLPIVYQQLFSKMSNPNVSVPQLAEVVSRDQALATKILKLVNSAFYGYKKEINTISRAMVILGFRTVRNAALAISVFDYVSGAEEDSRFPIEDFWKHSLCTASICKILGQRVGIKQQEETFVAGLLHDVGKLIMKKYFPEDFGDVCSHALGNDMSWCGAEAELLSIDHTGIAKAVLRSWNFPPTLVEAVQCHHSLSSGASYPGLVSLVNVSDHMSYLLGMGAPASLTPNACDPWSLGELGITIEDAMRSKRPDHGRDEPGAGDTPDHRLIRGAPGKEDGRGPVAAPVFYFIFEDRVPPSRSCTVSCEDRVGSVTEGSRGVRRAAEPGGRSGPQESEPGQEVPASAPGDPPSRSRRDAPDITEQDREGGTQSSAEAERSSSSGAWGERGR